MVGALPCRPGGPGFNTRSFLRSGFRQDTITDVINLDRLEVARGPQALLYGVASLGGIVALTPKYPRATQRTEARLGYGSDDFVRAELYNTGPIWKPKNDTRYLNYGVGLVYQNQSSRSDFDDRERLLVTPSVEFRPFKDTNVFVDIEYGRFSSTGNGFQDLGDPSAGNVRNPVTGTVVNRQQLRFGHDYTIDYLQGMVMLDKPLSSSALDKSQQQRNTFLGMPRIKPRAAG